MTVTHLCQTFVAVLLLWPGSLTLAAEPAPIELKWESNGLLISGPELRGREPMLMYLEAYCRGDSSSRLFHQSVIPHKSELISSSEGGRKIKLKCTVSDGVIVEHTITATHDEIDFRLTATNPTDKTSEIHWGQPCLRLGRFAGGDETTYLKQCFIFLDGKLERMPTRDWATEGLYTPGQVWVPKHVNRKDVNPRPLSKLVPSNGLIGCFSADESQLLAVAFEPYQELFQGVFGCIHSDFRIGGLKPGEIKKVRGKIYLLKNDIPALLKRYEKDFPEHAMAP